MVIVVSVGWGLLAGLALLRRVPSLAAAKRLSAMGGHAARRNRQSRRNNIVERVLRDVLARIRSRKADSTIEAQIPMVVELIAVAIGSGCSVIGAVEVVAVWSSPEIAAHFLRVKRAFLMGEPLAVALKQLGRSGTPLGNLGELLSDGAVLGTPLIEPLDRFATESRSALRRQAEARAKVVPVRLLFPLVFLILPAFGLITVVPAIDAGLRGG